MSTATALLLIGFGAGIGVAFADTHGGGVATTTPTSSGQEANTSAIASRVDPAIVNITSTVGGGPSSGEDLGTGLVLTPGGQVVTNNHVVAGATSIQVQISGEGRSHPASVIGADTANDVALLQVTGVSALPTITPGNSSSVALGDAVVAIGNALGLAGPPTVSSGTVTAVNRSVQAADPAGGTTEALTGLLQVDSPIEPGDSGGALANASGQVVGLVTAGATATSTSARATVGFAIPFTKVATIVDQFRAGEASPTVVLGQPGYLGVVARNPAPTSGTHLGLPPGSGAQVLAVAPRSPAASLGLSPGDVIVAVNGHLTDTAATLQHQIWAQHPGQLAHVTWMHGSEEHSGGVVLAAGPAV